jgi:hypothetical protein
MGGSKDLKEVTQARNEVKGVAGGDGFTPLKGSVIVIGGGTSAAVFARTAPRDLRRVVMVSPQLGQPVHLGPGEKKDVWSSVADSHRMGQIPPLLNGNLFNMGGGSRNRPVRILEPRRGVEDSKQTLGDLSRNHDQPHLQGFVSAHEFRAALEKLVKDARDIRVRDGGQLTLWADWVGTIGLDDGWPYVTLTACPRVKWHANHVVIATGPGEENKLQAVLGVIDAEVKDKINWTNRKDKINWRDDGSITTGGKFIEGRSQCEREFGNSRKWEVFIYGGSATASWVAEMALLRGYKVTAWWTRLSKEPGNKNDPVDRFATAFPAGDRNCVVNDYLKGVRGVYDIDFIFDAGKNQDVPRFMIAGRDKDNKVSAFPHAHQIVMCLGSDTDETFKKFFGNKYRNPDGGLKFYPKYDRNYALAGDSMAERRLLGFGTEKNEILILGAAVATTFDLAKDAGISRAVNFGSIADTLPRALAPDQGIGVLTASIEAFNEFMPIEVTGQERDYEQPKFHQCEHEHKYVPNAENTKKHKHVTNRDIKWNINFNTANRTQLAAYFASETVHSATVANFIVALIVAFRSFTTHGLTAESIWKIREWCERNFGAHPGGLRPADVDHTAWVLATRDIPRVFLATKQEVTEYEQGLKALRGPLQVKG